MKHQNYHRGGRRSRSRSRKIKYISVPRGGIRL